MYRNRKTENKKTIEGFYACFKTPAFNLPALSIMLVKYVVAYPVNTDFKIMSIVSSGAKKKFIDTVKHLNNVCIISFVFFCASSFSLPLYVGHTMYNNVLQTVYRMELESVMPVEHWDKIIILYDKLFRSAVMSVFLSPVILSSSFTENSVLIFLSWVSPSISLGISSSS